MINRKNHRYIWFLRENQRYIKSELKVRDLDMWLADTFCNKCTYDR